MHNCTHAIIACTDISVCINLQETSIQFVDSNNLLAKVTIEKHLQIKKQITTIKCYCMSKNPQLIS